MASIYIDFQGTHVESRIIGGSRRSCDGRSERSESAELGRETRAALSLGFLMGAFLICWLPFFIWMPLVTVMVNTYNFFMASLNLIAESCADMMYRFSLQL